jgi:hypothetical protein
VTTKPRKLPKSKRTIVVNTNEFVGMLTEIARFAGTDVTLPMLNGVLLHAAPGLLAATATDRFKLAQIRTGGVGALPDSLIRLGDVKRTITVLKGADVADNATLVRDEQTLTITTTSVTLRIEVAEVDFPNVATIFNGLTPTEGQFVAILPQQLAPFAAVAKAYREPLRMQVNGEVRPTLVSIGDNFRGLVMPCRLSDGQRSEAPLILPQREQAKQAPNLANAVADAKQSAAKTGRKKAA